MSSVTEETFSKVSEHMVKGLMLHDQLSNYYAFLGLRGLQKEQEYRFYDEVASFRRLSRYYVDHYNRLITETQFETPAVIPSGWYGRKRQEVDSATRRNAVSNGFSKWIKWEQETKALYEKASSDLYMDGTVAGSLVIEKLVSDVDRELAEAEREQIALETIGYDMAEIVDRQESVRKEYEEKIKELRL